MLGKGRRCGEVLLQALWLLSSQNSPLHSQMELWPRQSLCWDVTTEISLMLTGPQPAAGGAKEFVHTFANLRVSQRLDLVPSLVVKGHMGLLARQLSDLDRDVIKRLTSHITNPTSYFHQVLSNWACLNTLVSSLKACPYF